MRIILRLFDPICLWFQPINSTARLSGFSLKYEMTGYFEQSMVTSCRMKTLKSLKKLICAFLDPYVI